MNTREILKRFLITAFILSVLELGRQIVIPGIDVAALNGKMGNNTFLQTIALTTGAQYSKPTLFSLGLGPYMIVGIVLQAVQLLDLDFIKRISRDQMNLIRRWSMLIVVSYQAVRTVNYFKPFMATSHGDKTLIMFQMILVLTAGSMLVIWLADQNTEYGVGGFSIMIMPGLLSGTIRILMNGQGAGVGVLHLDRVGWGILIAVVLVFTVVTIFLSHAELRVPLYQIMVNNDLSDNYLPIPVLPSSSMPMMFAMLVFSLPRYLLGSLVNPKWFELDQLPGILLYGVVVAILGYFFSVVNVQPANTAKSMKESGSYFLDTLPGDDTEHLLNHYLNVSVFWNNSYLMIISLVPLLIGLKFNGIGNLAFCFANLYILINVIDRVIDEVRVMFINQRYTLL